jgi:hypothetical protein
MRRNNSPFLQEKDREPQKAMMQCALILYVQEYFERHNFLFDGIPLQHMAS